MKANYIAAGFFIAATIAAGATTLHFKKGNVTISFPQEQTGKMAITSAADESYDININGKTFGLNGSEMYFDEAEVEENTVTVTYASDGAKVDIAGNIADYVEATVDNGHVSIVQSKDVTDALPGEITYKLSGECNSGSFALEGSYKATIALYGLSLTNPQGAAMDIQNGKRIAINAKDGTVNSLTDGTDGDWKGCIVCKGHLEFKGKGELNITGNTAHAIYAKEYVEIKNCSLSILKSAKDGINCTQYFSMASGNVSIADVADDAIQIDFKDAENRKEEDTGSATITGGKLTAATSATAAKCIKAEGDININGGNLDLTVTGMGMWDSKKSKTKAAACLSADGDLKISNGDMTLHATGSGGKGASCDGTLYITGGKIDILTEGGIFAYVNNKENHNYTGNTDFLDSDLKSSPKGMKADTGVEISGGEINVTCTGNGGEGIESKGDLTISGGDIYAVTVDDCINSKRTMTISGGNVTVISSGNDGLDSNGDMYFRGGYTRAFGAGSPECGLDVNSEEGYKLYFIDGTVIGVGGNNSTPSNSGSTQPYVQGSMTVSKGETVTLKNGSEELASFEVPEEYKGSSSTGGPGGNRPGGGSSRSSRVLISCPGIVKGTSYTISNGTTSVNVSGTQYGSGGGMGGW